MRASIVHVAALAALVALPALGSAQAPASLRRRRRSPLRPPPPSVKVGDPAPDFDLGLVRAGRRRQGTRPSTSAKRIKLSDFKGKQNVVVAFFPAAFSPGCTNEMKQYQTSHGTFTAANTKVLGVSVDSTWSNRAFREQLGVEFPILSDWKRDAARSVRPARRELRRRPPRHVRRRQGRRRAQGRRRP